MLSSLGLGDLQSSIPRAHPVPSGMVHKREDSTSPSLSNYRKSLVQSSMKENSQEASADLAATDRRVIRGEHSATELQGGLRVKGNPQAPQRQIGQQPNSDKQWRNYTSLREQGLEHLCVSYEHMPTYCLQYGNPYKVFKTLLRPQ